MAEIDIELRTKLLDYERTLDCVHCGLCLPHCPTYQETGRESSSPRGRIYLMRGVAEGRLPLKGLVADEMYLCLGCRACESACPAGVEYGHLVEGMRAEIDRAGARSRSARWLERAALRGVIGSRRVMRSGAAALRLYERSGLQRLLRGRRLLGPLARVEALLPPASEPHRPPILIPARAPRRGRVAFFAGCVMPELFGSANEATVRVLAHNGFEVHVPSEQGCCGALNRHSGDPAGAERLHKRNRRAFSLESVDAVIVNAAGCGAALRDTGDELGNKVRDVSEWLVECGLVAPTRAVPRRVGYDDPCHLLHGQRVSEAPRRLLRAIPELELVELPGSSDCCGAAGTYNLTHPEMAERLLERKVAVVRSTGIDTLTTGNPGCLMQLGAGLRRAGLAVEVRHPVELLAEAYAD